MFSSNLETARGAEGLGHENEGWEHKWWSCNGGDRGAGGGRAGTTLTAEWSLPVRPALVFHLDLQVLCGRLTRLSRKTRTGAIKHLCVWDLHVE